MAQLKLKRNLTKAAKAALASGKSLTIDQANNLFFQKNKGMVAGDMSSVLNGQTMLNDKQVLATGHRIATKNYYSGIECQNDKAEIKAFYANRAAAATKRLNTVK